LAAIQSRIESVARVSAVALVCAPASRKNAVSRNIAD
jgi:hypothetical protein